MPERLPTTLDATIVHGPVGPGGWRPLVGGAGEARWGPAPTGEVLGSIWHLSDVHLCDAESPARLEYLDRFSDPDSPYRDFLGDIGTYRPQETLTVQVAVTMIETVNAVTSGPVTGAAIDIVLVTGDLTDNAQRNELSWYQRILEGGTVSPRSGDQASSSWVGRTDAATWDTRYWHPDGPPPGVAPDRPTRVFGYPTIPGLVDAARRDVVSPGLALPWLSVYGNHDGLLQGTVPPDDSLRSLATGDQRVVGLPEAADPTVAAEAIAEVGPARYVHDRTSPRTRVAPDPERDFVGLDEFVQTTRADAGGTSSFFTADSGRLRIIGLDTVNPFGGWQGSIDQEQFAWLEAQLVECADRYTVIASHHPSPTLFNDHRPPGASPRVLGDQILDLLGAHRQVIAWIAGHVHVHAALRHGDESHAFIELTTASLIDWPQQGRILEFVRDTTAGQVAIASTVVDHHAPATWDAEALHAPAQLASISRALAANDYRMREDSPRVRMRDSSPEVRNVVWSVPDPFA